MKLYHPTPPNKCLEIQHNKGVKDLYNKNVKVLKKENTENTKQCSWGGRINVVKMAVLLKLIYQHRISKV